MSVYRALYSVLKGLFRCGMRVTCAEADVRPLRTSATNRCAAGESALIVSVLPFVAYVKVPASILITRRFSSLIFVGVSGLTLMNGAASRCGLSQAAAGMPEKDRMTAQMRNIDFMEAILA